MDDGGATRVPTLAEATRVWARVGLLSFGGPAAQIALMHREVVERRRWLSEPRFLRALNFCMLLPGPEAQQLATYLGWLMHGVRGGAVAGALFVLPGAAVMLALSFLYVLGSEQGWLAGLFLGLRCAVLAVVVEALLRIARRALRGALDWGLAAAAFLALWLLALPFPLVVLAAGLVGLLRRPRPETGPGSGPASPALLDRLIEADPGRLARMAPGARRAGLVALALWLWPVAMLLEHGVWGEIAAFFSWMAVVTFGGAYAVLAWVAQEAVEARGWLTAADMLAGLGLAETTPGPLILVLQFVGFLAGWREAGGWGGVAGAALTLWVTFAPCFAWIFLGAPFMERLGEAPRLRGALAALTAAVVGVIANLALWFGARVLFAEVGPVPLGPFAPDSPVWSTLQPWSLVLVTLSFVALFALRLGLIPTLVLAAGLGWAGGLAGVG